MEVVEVVLKRVWFKVRVCDIRVFVDEETVADYELSGRAAWGQELTSVCCAFLDVYQECEWQSALKYLHLSDIVRA